VLLAGWLNTPEIVELDDRGNVTLYFARGICAIGTGKPHALIAHRTLERVTNVPPLEKLHWIMSVAAAMVYDCGPPVHIWRITAAGVTDALSRANGEASRQDAN
jgi:ATP-dependent protease HslVU (ClpYQ) peptidase subunit